MIRRYQCDIIVRFATQWFSVGGEWRYDAEAQDLRAMFKTSYSGGTRIESGLLYQSILFKFFRLALSIYIHTDF